MNEVKNTDTLINEKDIQIKFLEKEISENTFDNEEILKEAGTIFPGLTSLSIANHDFYTSNDSSFKTTVLIYGAKKELSENDKIKFENWLKQRLSIKNLQIFKQ